MTNKQITRALMRTYSDNQQTVGLVEWSDGSRTEGPADGAHMRALLQRAHRDGKFVGHEIW